MPEPPPSSATVTTAVMFSDCRFRPRSMVESPVPPPMTTMRGSASRLRLLMYSPLFKVAEAPRGGDARLLQTVRQRAGDGYAPVPPARAAYGYV